MQSVPVFLDVAAAPHKGDVIGALDMPPNA
jgi:hypothetical protein